jgi:hypothetical protein
MLGLEDPPGVLLREGRPHAERALLRTGPIGGLARTPGRGLGIEIIEILPGTGGKEGVADVADGALHAPLTKRLQLHLIRSVGSGFSASPIRFIPGTGARSR